MFQRNRGREDHRTRRRQSVVVMVVLTALAVGCSSSGGRAPTGAKAATTSGRTKTAQPPVVVGRSVRFETTELVGPAGEAFTVEFDNEDAGIPHNLAVYRSGPPAADKVAATPVANGTTRQRLRLGPVAPGRYFYQCDVHPTTMTGTLTVR